MHVTIFTDIAFHIYHLAAFMTYLVNSLEVNVWGARSSRASPIHLGAQLGPARVQSSGLLWTKGTSIVLLRHLSQHGL